MGKKGKDKGSRFERDVCRALSLWLTGNLNNDVLWRTAGSGARATAASNRASHARHAHSAGDVGATTEAGRAWTRCFFTECKNYKDLGLAAYLTCRPSLLQRFWEQACEQAQTYRLAPVLIAKQNLYPVLVLMRVADAEMLGVPRGIGVTRDQDRVIPFELFIEHANAQKLPSRVRPALDPAFARQLPVEGVGPDRQDRV